jgi:hypothetical protein
MYVPQWGSNSVQLADPLAAKILRLKAKTLGLEDNDAGEKRSPIEVISLTVH